MEIMRTKQYSQASDIKKLRMADKKVRSGSTGTYNTEEHIHRPKSNGNHFTSTHIQLKIRAQFYDFHLPLPFPLA